MDISIIIPSYNRIWSLPKAIESCKGNEGLSIQIIVVDDGSNDGTWDLLKQMNNIEIYRQENWGKPWAVNMAMLHAKGKYIKFLDSDDWLIPGSLLKQYRLAEKENADIVVAGYQIYRDENLIKTLEWIHCDDFISQNLGECDSSHYSAFLFRREFIIDIPHRTSFASANFASRDDRCFMLEAALKKPNLITFNMPAFCHLHHEKGRLQFQKRITSACTNYQHLLIYKNILNQLSDSGQLTQRRITASVNVLWPLCQLIGRDNINEAFDTFKWLKSLKPDFKIPEKGILGFLYKSVGFRITQKVLRVGRFIRYGWQ